ncbi:sulfotransferase family protein [Celeribacter arenosi]|uniref:Sulfotransferase family protein n=1 Tax=Celeribacter arenosi TaxID=792649 RepID=A0ABP7K2R9_9RHOB
MAKRTTAQKICCVGFQKTGTTSLSSALMRLGYSVGQSWREVNAALDPHSEDAREVVAKTTIDILRDLDAIQDSPCAFLFEEFDREFPGSKFILTYRPVEDWLASYDRFFEEANNPLRTWMYGVETFVGNEDTYRKIYLEQNEKIRTYFADRPEDFLELDLSKGDGWYELVNFLGPDFLPGFPRENAGRTQKLAHQPFFVRLRRRLKNWVKRALGRTP